jgi:hypothetical protein
MRAAAAFLSFSLAASAAVQDSAVAAVRPAPGGRLIEIR